MNDEFITRAIENDRYLKAIRLINRFETEIEGELKRVTSEFISGNEDLFDTGVDQRFNVNRNAGPVLTHARVNTDMNQMSSAQDGATNLTLNITLRWLDPAEYGLSDVNGALCVTAYKINGATTDDHNKVKRQTVEDSWDISWCRDAYNNAPEVAYVPVESAEEIQQGFDTLKQHFWKYGSEYGVDPDSME
ncbi:hypothetical protein [Salinibaculum rarum]|uniref:hypothetical protein n=1 Tax=Salinibaculum rarum TaxID=3058903 RepID=UPI00265E1BE0|nr:hypothetical protein [Salinibaculum sp. KK48]